MAGENKNRTEFVVETKKVAFFIISIIALGMFVLGYLSRGDKEETVSFTYDEIRMIESFQTQLETEIGQKAEVIVYKDKKGNLMLGWK